MFAIADVIKNDYTAPMTSKEFKRLLEKEGAIFLPGKGSHMNTYVSSKFGPGTFEIVKTGKKSRKLP